MLWEYTQISLLLAVVFTYSAFSRNTIRIGRIFYLFTGGLSWLIVTYGLLKITFQWPGMSAYTYIPAWEAWVVPSATGILWLLMWYMGAIGIFSKTEGE